MLRSASSSQCTQCGSRHSAPYRSLPPNSSRARRSASSRETPARRRSLFSGPASQASPQQFCRLLSFLFPRHLREFTPALLRCQRRKSLQCEAPPLKRCRTGAGSEVRTPQTVTSTMPRISCSYLWGALHGRALHGVAHRRPCVTALPGRLDPGVASDRSVSSTHQQ